MSFSRHPRQKAQNPGFSSKQIYPKPFLYTIKPTLMITKGALVFQGKKWPVFIAKRSKIILQTIVAFFFISMSIWFLKHEGAELFEVKQVLLSSKSSWIGVGVLLSAIYIVMQALMYVSAFASVGSTVTLPEAIVLFLKRNFISVFLPAGGISSLMFFSSKIQEKGVSKSQINFASGIYGFVGILTVILLAIPAFLFAVLKGPLALNDWIGLASVILLTAALFLIYQSILKKGVLYSYLTRVFPSTREIIEDLLSNKLDKQQFVITIAYSFLIELIGVAHLYVAMYALNLNPSVFIAVMGYVIAVLFMIVSPFLRGIGAVELSMAFLLSRFGFNNIQAISITFLYRFFEFWLPLFAGVTCFLLDVNKFIMRILPALLLLLLGILNIVSVLTPAISTRIAELRHFLPIDAINASNLFVFMAGLFLIATAAFMLKGLRTAWYFALALCTVSLVGHLAKAIDYEEAIASLFVIVILLVSQKAYYVKNSRRLSFFGVKTTLLSIAAVLLYGIIGFYFLDKRHFNIDFSLLQSIRYTIQSYFLIDSGLTPRDNFARNFLYSINISGFISLTFLLYSLLRPYISSNSPSKEELEQASGLLKEYGNSAMDFFKVYPDKLIFTSKETNSFLSYRVSGNFAVVLENPIAKNRQEMKACIAAFDRFCYQNGLKSLYYRVPEESLATYAELRKKKLFLGQEGIVDLQSFTLEGGDKKSMRNALNKIKEKGYKEVIYSPPVKDGVLQKIKAVSDEWLTSTGRKELVFSQGMFIEEQLKQQTLITVENSEEKIVAFLNIIPDYAKNEGTYDLIRKTADAPNGVVDFILIALFNYLKSQGYTAVNLGFAPLSGLSQQHSFPERSMNFAYEKLRSFSHYKGLREYKEKFSPAWYNKYLIYDDDYDLMQVPKVLTKVMSP